MKRILALTLAFLMVATVFLLASCEKPADTSSGETSSEVSVEPELSNLETLKLSFEKLSALFPDPDEAFGIKMPELPDDRKTNEGIADIKIKLDDLKLPEGIDLPDCPIVLNARMGEKGENILADFQLELFDEKVNLSVVGNTEGESYLEIKNVTDLPIQITAKEEGDETSSFDLSGLIDGVKKIFTEGFDWENKITVEKSESGLKTIKVGLNDEEIRGIAAKFNELLKDSLGDVISGIGAVEGETSETEDADIITLDEGKLAANLEVKTQNDTPTSILFTTSVDEKTKAKVLFTVTPASASEAELKLSVCAVEEADEGEEASDELKEMLSATIVSKYAAEESKLTLDTTVTLNEFSLGENEYDTVTLTITMAYHKDADNKIGFTFDTSAQMKQGNVSAEMANIFSGDGSVTYGETNYELTLNSKINAGEEFSCKADFTFGFDADVSDLTIDVPKEFVTTDEVDPEALIGKLSENSPAIAAVLMQIIGANHDGEYLYFCSEEGDVNLLCVVTEEGMTFDTLTFNYLTYTDNGKQLTFTDDFGKKLFSIPYTTTPGSGTGTIYGMEVGIYLMDEDSDFPYVEIYSEEGIDILISAAQGDASAQVSFFGLVFDGTNLVQQFPDGHTMKWKLQPADEYGTSYLLDGTLLTLYQETVSE